MKYSPKFDRIIDEIDASSMMPERRFALIDFQLQLEMDAPMNACLRCAQGEFLIQYKPHTEKVMGKWTPVLGHCRAFIVLARNAEDAPGLQLPGAPFCTSFKAVEEGKS